MNLSTKITILCKVTSEIGNSKIKALKTNINRIVNIKQFKWCSLFTDLLILESQLYQA